MIVRLIIVCYFILLLPVLSFAQPELNPVQEEMVRAELDKRGLKGVSIDEVTKRLEDKGIDVNNPDPAQADAVQKALDEIYIELEAEKAAENPKVGEGVEAKPPSKAEQNAEKQQELLEDAGAEKVIEAAAQADKPEESGGITEIIKITEQQKDELVYGQEIFLDLNMEAFIQNTQIRPSENYILGETDEIIINITGPSADFSKNYTITNGRIKPSQMDEIFLKGLTFRAAKELLKKRFSQFYRFKDEDFHVSLNYSRNIMVNVTGMARNFGSFYIPAANTAFTALIAAKGPSKEGTVRNIKIHSSGKSAQTFDLYEYLLKPEMAEDFVLQNNDYVHIPIQGKVVSISGAITRPRKYELKDNEHLKKLLFWAGGVKSNAYQKNITVIRYEDDQEKIININLRELNRTGRDFKLKDGDRIRIPNIPSSFKNFVTVEGAVELPGEFELIQGMKVSDLVLQSQPDDLAKLDVAYLFRQGEGTEKDPIKINISEILDNPSSADNLTLLPKDRLRIFSVSQFEAQNRVVSLSGAVRNPNEYPYSSKMKISDVITMSGGLREDATGMAFILRRNLDELEPTDYIKFNVFNVVNNPDSNENILLAPGDRIQIYSYTQLREGYSPEVQINGAVLNPSTYSYSSKMTIKDLLLLSGGLQLQADQARIDVYRVKIEQGEPTNIEEIIVEVDEDYNAVGYDNGEFFLAPFDIVQVRYTPDFEMQQNVIISGEVTYPGTFAITKPNERISDIIKRAGGFKETAFERGMTIERPGMGKLIMDVEDVLENPNSPSNYIVQAGDVITIPKRMDLVFIASASLTKADETEVNLGQTVNVPYVAGKNARYYVDEFLGGVDKSDGGRYRLISVIQPGGKIDNTKDYGFFKRYPEVLPGATIKIGKIPERERKRKERDDKEREPVDWGEILANTVAQATAVLTLIILIQRIQ